MGPKVGYACLGCPYVSLGALVGPWILVIAPDWSRRVTMFIAMCLLMCGCQAGPFQSLCLVEHLYLGSFLLVSCIFEPNLPAHIYRLASVEFVNKSSYASIYSL